MKIGSTAFTSEQYSLNSSPAVYELFKNGKCLYVGFAGHGLHRLFTIQKKHVNRALAFKIADRFEISFYESQSDAIYRNVRSFMQGLAAQGISEQTQ